MFPKPFKIFIILVVLLGCTMIIADVAMDVMVLNETSLAAETQELQGIQGASITATEVQVSKATQRGKKDQAKTLDSLMKEQIQCYTIINGALEVQRTYYTAYKGGKEGQIKKSLSDLNSSIPKAQNAFKKLQKITERKISLIKSTTGDVAAINVEKASLASWAAAVKALSTKPMTEDEVAKRNDSIEEQSSIAIKTAHNMARFTDPASLSEEQKKNLKINVVDKGEEVIKNLGDVIKVLPQLMLSMVQGASVGMKMANDAMGSYSDMGKMMHDATYNQGFFNKGNMSKYQRSLDGVGKRINGFLGYYTPFIQTVGDKVGSPVSVSPSKGSSGEGDEIVFVDPEGRYILVGDSKEYSQILIDRLATKMRSCGDVQMMVIFEYTDAYREAFLKGLKKKNPQAAAQLSSVAIEYCFVRLSKYHRFERFAVIERNFQDAKGRELLHVQYPATETEEIIRKSPMEKAMRLAVKISKNSGGAI
ncbi:MAG: hypothetical protein EOM02_06740 [Synergistales bacterium]|nr:hypothetical protein [Synergistales bacterium]